MLKIYRFFWDTIIGIGVEVLIDRCEKKNLTPEDRVIVQTIFKPLDNGFIRESNIKVVSPSKEKEEEKYFQINMEIKDKQKLIAIDSGDRNKWTIDE